MNLCNSKFEAFKGIFIALCILCTLGFTYYCFHKYLKDEDASKISFVDFYSDKESIYPALTLCFGEPFLDEKFPHGVNVKMFKEFLQGQYWNQSFLSIGYEDVSKNIDDYLHAAETSLQDWSTRKIYRKGKENLEVNEEDRFIPIYSVGLKNHEVKCWIFDIPNIQNNPILELGLTFNCSIFKDCIRPENIGKGIFKLTVGFAQQQTRSRLKHSMWKKRDHIKAYTMRFEIQNVVVMEHRNKHKHPCNENWQHYDEISLTKTAKKLGCKLAHWGLPKAIPICSTQFAMKKAIAAHNALAVDKTNIPCRRIEKILHSYNEIHGLEHNNKKPPDNLFRVLLKFQGSSYTEIRQVPSFDLQSLVGNSGGYLGLFLGYALSQLPDMIKDICCRIMGAWKNR